MMNRLKSLPSTIYLGFGLVGIVAYINVLKVFIGGEALIAQIFPLVVLPLIIPLSVISFYYWKGLDEGAKEGQKSGYLWGTQLGMLALIIFCFFFDVQGVVGPFLSDYLAPFSQSSEFLNGMFTLGIFQTIGFILFWAFWWIRRR